MSNTHSPDMRRRITQGRLLVDMWQQMPGVSTDCPQDLITDVLHALVSGGMDVDRVDSILRMAAANFDAEWAEL